MCRRRIGQEWKASSFADPPSGRRRKADSDAVGPKKGSKRPAAGDEISDETHHDLGDDGAAGDDVLLESEATQHSVREVGVLGDPAAAAAALHADTSSLSLQTGSFAPNFPDISLVSDAALLTSTTLPVCLNDASLVAAGEPLSPIDNVFSCDPVATSASLDASGCPPQQFQEHLAPSLPCTSNVQEQTGTGTVGYQDSDI